ncbi:unnamed protein product [Paramecium pentaurelia]|uniref:Uncharacterized protein n=1 Tax=Paramecium pentaurelia TaxID=43138 RepID=A0A8S1WA57_9CILI|nr:unnamed protein product [Paramecium pentaurelia]
MSTISREEYAKKMRLALSDNHICKPDGTVNHQYFLVKKGQYWAEEKIQFLIEQLEKVGVGNWKLMQKGLLEQTSDIELELRTCLLFKTTDIQPYMDKKYTKNEIEQIAQQNIEKAQQLSKLKYGVFVV